MFLYFIILLLEKNGKANDVGIIYILNFNFFKDMQTQYLNIYKRPYKSSILTIK